MTKIKPIQHRIRAEVLSAEQLAEIKAATLHVLETVGIHFPSERALAVFAEHGAIIDLENQIVRLPPDLVLEAMSHAPRTYTLAGRADGTELTLDGTASFYSTDGCGTETIDRDIWIPELTHPAATRVNVASPDIRERARVTFKRILTEHQPEPLSKDLQIELQTILKAAER